VPNFLFQNRGKGRFDEIGVLAGVGYNPFGLARSGMGVDAADYDQDGRLDLFVSNVDHESFALYRNAGKDFFADSTMPSGIATQTNLLSGWGLRFFDYDNDGNLDLILCNGHPDLMVEDRVQDITYREPMLLFRNDGSGHFSNASAQGGAIFSKNLAGRGLALGDFDNDGALDVLVSVNNGAPVLLRNLAGKRNHWLGLKLVGKTANIDAIGAKISYKAGGLTRSVYKAGGGSYLSSHDPRVVLGLGQNAKVDWVEIAWPNPSGKTERFVNLPIDRYVTIVEGQGQWK
jgi:hypothetical protein